MTNQPKTLADFLHADSERLKRAADIALVALVISLPWSTSATAIGVVVWLCLLLPTLSWPEMRRAITSPQGGLPLLLVTLGVAGMFWSTARWGERFDGADSFLKLLTIPILFAQFARGQSGKAALAGYLASCLVLLLASYYSVVLAHFYFSDHVPFLKYLSERAPGVPVKDYIAQSGEFVFSIFILLWLCVHWSTQRRYLWAALGALAVAGFVINLGFVAVSKTSLVVAPVLFLLFGIRFLKPRAMALLFLGGAVIAALVLASSPYLRKRVSAVLPEVQSYFKSETASSSGERLEYWKKAITFVSEAPVIGHGTGSIADLYRRAQSGEGLSAEMTENPHNQTAAVAIQLGLLGVAILWAMWLAHLWMFRAQGLAAWTGFVLVVQNVIASAFNSHLFDFTEGWTYVIGVGIAGGLVRQARIDKSNNGAG